MTIARFPRAHPLAVNLPAPRRAPGPGASHPAAMSADRVVDLDDPQLRAFAPLIYVAWSDFDLDDDERRRVIAAMAAQPWLRPAARAVIEAWIDPEEPPRAEELARLRTLIDRVGSTSSARARASFARVARGAASDHDARRVADELARDLGMFAGAD
ncbi:MAG TPA: hypothetical protein VFP84_36285, partial [Kofleriaceae bacterium]|nr:hypothetical protein [Kofleriaceae bacterium]